MEPADTASVASESAAARDLKSLFCEKFGCAPSKFERRALRKCRYFHARLIAPLTRLIIPGVRQRDLEFIDYFGKARSRQQATAEIADLHYIDRAEPLFARRTLRLRISIRKARKLADVLFPT